MTTRNERLMQARHATESAPVSEVRYTDHELGQRDAYREAAGALRGLAAKWQAENTRQASRKVVIARHFAALERDRSVADGQPDVTTSVTEDMIPGAEQSFPLTREITPFPLCRPVLKSKVAPAKPVAAKRRISALGNFFQAVAVFIKA